MFLVNVPIGIGLLVIARRHLPGERGSASRQLDPAGVVLLSLSVLLLVVPLVLGHDEHWPVWGWVSLGASVVLFGAFVAVGPGVATASRVPGRRTGLNNISTPGGRGRAWSRVGNLFGEHKTA